MSLAIVVEGDTDLPVVRKLASDAGIAIHIEIDAGGKDQLDAHLHGYNQAARGSPWFVLRDIDSDPRCAGRIVKALVGTPSGWMTFRLAMRELESWLLADAEAIAEFLHVDVNRVPKNPDAERDPTQTIVNLARRSSVSRVRAAFVPRPGTSASVGPLYESEIIRFGRELWSLARASRRSESLRRARAALRNVARRWRSYVGER